jgi:hypothetical protein
VAAPAVAVVERPCVAVEEAVHPGADVPARCLDEQVDVIRHQAERVDAELVERRDPVEQAEEGEPVVAVAEDRLPVDPARRQVVDRAGELDAEWAGHRWGRTGG